MLYLSNHQVIILDSETGFLPFENPVSFSLLLPDRRYALQVGKEGSKTALFPHKL
jgi:hypothetical protein